MKHSLIKYLEGLHILVCSRCQTYVEPSEDQILKHLRVGDLMPPYLDLADST